MGPAWAAVGERSCRRKRRQKRVTMAGCVLGAAAGGRGRWDPEGWGGAYEKGTQRQNETPGALMCDQEARRDRPGSMRMHKRRERSQCGGGGGTALGPDELP